MIGWHSLLVRTTPWIFKAGVVYDNKQLLCSPSIRYSDNAQKGKVSCDKIFSRILISFSPTRKKHYCIDKNEWYLLQHIPDTFVVELFPMLQLNLRKSSRENKAWSGRPRILDPRNWRSLVRLIWTNILILKFLI